MSVLSFAQHLLMAFVCGVGFALGAMGMTWLVDRKRGSR